MSLFCLEGVHRPGCLICIFKILSGSIKKQPTTSIITIHNAYHPLSPTDSATGDLHLPVSPADCLWQRSDVTASGIWHGRSSLCAWETEMPIAAVLPLSLSVTSYFPQAWPEDWCVTAGLNKGAHIQCKTSITEGLCHSCTALALWLNCFSCLTCPERKRSHAEISIIA